MNSPLHSVVYDRIEESMEAKVLWFRALPLTERMEFLCEFTELALAFHPELPDRKDAQQTQRHIQILSAI
jgi:hypothetical protein